MRDKSKMRVYTYLLKKDYKRFKKACDFERVSMAEYLRRCIKVLIKNYEKKETVWDTKSFEKQMLRSISGIGNNMNQIAHQLNYYHKVHSIPTQKDLDNILNELREMNANNRKLRETLREKL